MGGRFSRDVASVPVPDPTSDGDRSRAKFYKLLLVGDPGVGKSWIITRFVHDRTGPDTFTMGQQFSSRKVELDESEIKLQIWDMGQSGSIFHGYPSSTAYLRNNMRYFQAADGIMLVYDVTDRGMFDEWDWDWWIEKARVEKASGKVPIILVANKCDRTDYRAVEYERARDFADENGMSYIEVSAKDGTNVELAFMSLVAQIQEQERNCDRTAQ